MPVYLCLFITIKGMHYYKELNIWKRSIQLAKELFTITDEFPSSLKYTLIDQIRRAATSVPSNIAEGCGRNTAPQTSHFINIAFGSLCEVETQIILSAELNFISETKSKPILKEINELKKMIWSFSISLKKSK